MSPSDILPLWGKTLYNTVCPNPRNSNGAAQSCDPDLLKKKAQASVNGEFVRHVGDSNGNFDPTIG